MRTMSDVRLKENTTRPFKNLSPGRDSSISDEAIAQDNQSPANAFYDKSPRLIEKDNSSLLRKVTHVNLLAQ